MDPIVARDTIAAVLAVIEMQGPCNGEVVILLVLLRRDKQEFALRHVRDLQVVQSTARCPIALNGTLRGRCAL